MRIHDPEYFFLVSFFLGFGFPVKVVNPSKLLEARQGPLLVDLKGILTILI